MPSRQTQRRQKVKEKRSHGTDPRRHRNYDGYQRVHSDMVLPSIEMPPTPPADSPPSEPTTPRCRKRRRGSAGDGAKGRRQRRFTSPSPTPESEVETEMVWKRVDCTYRYDPHDVEAPSRNACLPWLSRDATGNYAPLTDRTKINDQIPKPVVSDLVFPDILDDSKDMVVVEYERPKKKKTKKTRTKQARGQREDSGVREDDPVNIAEYNHTSDGALDLPTQPPSQPSQPKTPYEPNPWKRQSGSGLMSKLHLEIRQMIWRELLVAPEPVLVWGKWKKIYSRQKPKISIQLIRVCKALYEEGLPILYGQNTFRYLIRDTVNTTATLTNINHPALTVGNPGFIDDTVADDSGSDWERDCGPDSARRNNNPTKRMTRSAARQKKSAEVADINVEKFAHLFRHLMIEAESNRYDQDIQERMSEAIEVFKFKDGADNEADDGGIAQGGNQRLIVNTLTIRVTPQRLRDSVHGYTFVDFFDQGSAVINAVKSIDCQLFRIEVFRQKQNSDETRDRAMCQRGEDLTAVEVDFFHQRAAYNIHKFGEKDLWANDPVAKQQRMKGIQRGRLLLDNLAENVKKACRSLEGPPAVDQ